MHSTLLVASSTSSRMHTRFRSELRDEYVLVLYLAANPQKTRMKSLHHFTTRSNGNGRRAKAPDRSPPDTYLPADIAYIHPTPCIRVPQQPRSLRSAAPIAQRSPSPAAPSSPSPFWHPRQQPSPPPPAAVAAAVPPAVAVPCPPPAPLSLATGGGSAAGHVASSHLAAASQRTRPPHHHRNQRPGPDLPRRGHAGRRHSGLVRVHGQVQGRQPASALWGTGPSSGPGASSATSRP